MPASHKCGAFAFGGELARNCVPVYSKNADRKRERPIYYVSLTEANLLTEKDSDGDSKAVQVSKRNDPLQIQLLNLVTPDINSPASISFREVEAYVGLRGSSGYIQRVRDKVDSWNACGEPRQKWLKT